MKTVHNVFAFKIRKRKINSLRMCTKMRKNFFYSVFKHTYKQTHVVALFTLRQI